MGGAVRNREGKLDELATLRRIADKLNFGIELDEILEHIIRVVVDVTSAEGCFIYLYNSQRRELVLLASKNPRPGTIGGITLKLGEGIAGAAAEQKAPIEISENAYEDARFKIFQSLPEDRYESILSVPMLRKAKLIGVINIQHRNPHITRPQVVSLLELIANLAAGAVENGRLFEETRKKAQQLDLLSNVSSTIISNDFLDNVLDFIVASTAGVMDSKICSLMLVSEDGNELQIKATQSLSPEYRKKPGLPVHESIIGRAVLDGKPLQVPDVSREPFYRQKELAKKEGFCSLLCVPMLYKGTAIGVFNVYSSSPRIFTDDEIRILQAVANQAAAAIEHARLIEKSARLEDALETKKLVDKAKALLMKKNRMTEDECHKFMQKQSMNMRKNIKEIAQAILLSKELSL